MACGYLSRISPDRGVRLRVRLIRPGVARPADRPAMAPGPIDMVPSSIDPEPALHQSTS